MQNKISIYLVALFLVSSVYSQSFDKNFIESLPENIAIDLQNRAMQRDADEQVQYRRPSTFIDKPEIVSDRFGSKIFSMMQTTLMPINEPNYDSSYILDFGDEVELQLIGERSYSKKIIIRGDGSINIEDLGKVYIAGLSLEDAVNLIRAKINSTFIGVDAFLTITSVRNIQVLVVGNVYNPGPYTLNGNSNIFHALSVSGGPSELGSFRSIKLIRENKIIETIDLYETLINGQFNLNKRLKSGDTIFVDPAKKIVSIDGAVKRPGEYEMINDENADQLLKFANGLSADADLFEMKLERIINGQIKQLPIINLDDLKKISLKDSDRIFIRAHSFREISVLGAVKNPGVYMMNEGDDMFDAISKAGGFSKNAYPFGGVYESKEARAIYEMAAEELYKDFLDVMLEMSQADVSKSGTAIDESSIKLTQELKETDITGRVIANFLDEDQDSPILVKDGDLILIPEKTSQVYVYGEIASEGAALYENNKDLFFYINKKGGLKTTADKKSIYILYPNGESKLLNSSRNIFAQNSKDDIQVYPGSVIFVPRKIDTGYSARMRAQAYATIIGNLGVSLASLSVLKD